MSAQREKASQMILRFAGDYIRLGDDLEHKQQLLQGAVSAWNIACLPEQSRTRAIKKYMKEYRKYNPDQTKRQISYVEKDMKQLIKTKMSMYPDDVFQIVNAEVREVEGKLHVTAISINRK